MGHGWTPQVMDQVPLVTPGITGQEHLSSLREHQADFPSLPGGKKPLFLGWEEGALL